MSQVSPVKGSTNKESKKVSKDFSTSPPSSDRGSEGYDGSQSGSAAGSSAGTSPGGVPAPAPRTHVPQVPAQVDASAAHSLLYAEGIPISVLFPGVPEGLLLWEAILKIYAKKQNATVDYFDINGRPMLAAHPCNQRHQSQVVWGDPGCPPQIPSIFYLSTHPGGEGTHRDYVGIDVSVNFVHASEIS